MDNGSVATEVYRLLAEDNDCVIHQLGTRGPSGGKHEGRGSWTFARYLADTDYAGKTNAFWDKIKGRLDFQKYCETNGYEGIDYFLIALGTNDVSQGTTLYRTEAEVQKFVDQAKQFIDALLDKETGFPNCKIGIGLCGPGSDYSYQCGSSMGIFHMSINTLNLALIKAFDAGKYRKNVTCFAHGLRTDRRLAFPYSDKPVTNRFTETSRTLTNSTAMSGVLRRLVRIPESIWKNTPIRIPFGGASVRSGSGTVSRRRTVLPTRKRIAGARKAACQMRKRKLQTSAAPQNATMSVRWSRVSWNCSTA